MLNKISLILAVVIVALIVGISSYGAYVLYSPTPIPSPSVSPSSNPSNSSVSSPSETATPSATPTSTSMTTPTSQPTPNASTTQTHVPTPTENPTSMPTSTPIPTATITPTPTTAPTPTATSTPTPTPRPTSVVVDDANGAQINVTLPVKRIICLTSAEIVCALGASDLIVGRVGMLTSDAQAVLPPSIMQLPNVGDADTAPNMELILELEPDLVLASQRLTDANRLTLENAGIAVIEDTLTGTRREKYIMNLALILDAEAKANELISFEVQYENLVKERVANLSRSQKPLVFFEWYQPWFSTGPGGSYHLMIEAAGGIDVGENATSGYPQLSSEFVMEQNPGIFIRMLDYTSGENFTSFQNLWNSIFSRPGVSGLKAAEENKIYVIKGTLLVDRDVIGLLYFAKWFHPTLFADIDPAAIHAQMIHEWFGTTLEGVYLYP